MAENAGPPSILIADPDALTVELVRTICQSLGFGAIYSADHGEKAFRRIEQDKPDIVVAELLLPELDGLGLVKRLRDPMTSPNLLIPIIMLSGGLDAEKVIAARDAGVTELLAKPLTAKAMFQRLKSVILEPRAFIMTDEFLGPDRRRANRSYTGPERRQGSSKEAPGVQLVDPDSAFAKALRKETGASLFT